MDLVEAGGEVGGGVGGFGLDAGGWVRWGWKRGEGWGEKTDEWKSATIALSP